MRTSAIAIAIASLATASTTFAGVIDIRPEDLRVRMLAERAGASASFTEFNAPRASGDLSNLRFEGAVAIEGPGSETFTDFYTLGAFADFSTGSHAHAVEAAGFDLNLRIISNASLTYSITAGFFSGGPDALDEPLANLVYGISFNDLLDGPVIETIDDGLQTFGDEDEPLFILPAFTSLRFGIAIELAAGGPDDPDAKVNALLEFGGDTPFQGLETGFQVRQLPTPGAAALFAMAAATIARRRR
jgi:hypothetical protein